MSQKFIITYVILINIIYQNILQTSLKFQIFDQCFALDLSDVDAEYKSKYSKI